MLAQLLNTNYHWIKANALDTGPTPLHHCLVYKGKLVLVALTIRLGELVYITTAALPTSGDLCTMYRYRTQNVTPAGGVLMALFYNCL